jgi:hypothetical protein
MFPVLSLSRDPEVLVLIAHLKAGVLPPGLILSELASCLLESLAVSFRVEPVEALSLLICAPVAHLGAGVSRRLDRSLPEVLGQQHLRRVQSLDVRKGEVVLEGTELLLRGEQRLAVYGHKGTNW